MTGIRSKLRGGAGNPDVATTPAVTAEMPQGRGPFVSADAVIYILH